MILNLRKTFNVRWNNEVVSTSAYCVVHNTQKYLQGNYDGKFTLWVYNLILVLYILYYYIVTNGLFLLLFMSMSGSYE